MDTKIKEGQLERLPDFGFKENRATYMRTVKDNLILLVDKKTRHMVLRTPFGEAAFMESHKDKFQDLIDADMVKFIKGKFDR